MRTAIQITVILAVATLTACETTPKEPKRKHYIYDSNWRLEPYETYRQREEYRPIQEAFQAKLNEELAERRKQFKTLSLPRLKEMRTIFASLLTPAELRLHISCETHQPASLPSIGYGSGKQTRRQETRKSST